MIKAKELSRVKGVISKCTGKRVRLTANKGKKKVSSRSGVIESVHNSIFVVKLDDIYEELPANRRISYSYADILTNNIEIKFCQEVGA